MATFLSNIVLGDEYEDTVTGFKGKATDVSFNYMKCIRVWLEPEIDKDKKLADGAWFDGPRLRHTKTKEMLGAGDIHDEDLVELAPIPSQAAPPVPPLARTGGPVSRVK